jgi:hypothetical protein
LVACRTIVVHLDDFFINFLDPTPLIALKTRYAVGHT